MALKIADRVRETTTTTGTGTINLGGAVTNFETFAANLSNSDTTYYAIVDNTNGAFEVGLGTFSTGSPNTLARTTPIASSNSNSAVNFGAGTKDVFITLPASKNFFKDASGSINENLVFGDSTELQFGAGTDLKILHTGSVNQIVGSGSDGEIQIQAHSVKILDNGGNLQASFSTTGSESALYHIGTKVLETLSNGIEIPTGVLSIKNTGSQSVARFYCESSNAHYAEIKAPAHSDFSGNVTLTLPATTSNIVGDSVTQTLTNKTLTAPVLSGSSSAAGSILFKEDTDNGTNAVTLIGPASTADVTITLPSSAGTVALTSDIPSGGISSGNVATFTSGVADNDFLRVDGTAVEGRSASEVLSDIGGQASLTFGISDTNAVKIDSSSVADDEFARFTASGLESRSASEVRSDIGLGTAATLAVGISNTNVAQFGSGVADNDFLRVDGTTIEGRSASEVASDIGAATTDDATALAIALG